YFSLGQITFRNDAGESQGMQNPNEFAIDFGYTRLLSDKFSGSVALRYIHSDLGTSMTGTETLRPGNAFAADVSFYYQQELKSDRYKNLLSAGVDISNIGSKISYGDGTKYFIPTNLRMGVAYSSEIDRSNKFTVSMDLNKLLVPTPKSVSLDQESSVVVGGNTSDKSVIGGIFSSFTDAPGGLKEELQEVTIGLGGEYLYNGQFALRGGYFYENQNKGNRKYFTAGAGVKMNAFSLDFSYLIPTQQNHPLENTLRFSLSFDFGQLASVAGLSKSHK
ncbi:MAG: type IX secretion system outer membrane channel protein PorV, partial [Bacteroidota bacterium]|nr:type IX secretion system outer membrane channel protein PorV [Bacteroidota bacterium]